VIWGDGARWARCRAAFYDRPHDQVRRCTLGSGHAGNHAYRTPSYPTRHKHELEHAPEAPCSFTRAPGRDSRSAT
jgi:hypothetical protein